MKMLADICVSLLTPNLLPRKATTKISWRPSKKRHPFLHLYQKAFNLGAISAVGRMAVSETMGNNGDHLDEIRHPLQLFLRKNPSQAQSSLQAKRQNPQTDVLLLRYSEMKVPVRRLAGLCGYPKEKISQHM